MAILGQAMSLTNDPQATGWILVETEGPEELS